MVTDSRIAGDNFDNEPQLSVATTYDNLANYSIEDAALQTSVASLNYRALSFLFDSQLYDWRFNPLQGDAYIVFKFECPTYPTYYCVNANIQ